MSPTFEFQPVLKGDLVTMRPYSDRDWDQLLSVASDPLIWEQHPIHKTWSEGVFRLSIEDALSEHGSLVATETATGRIIGHSRYSTRYVQSGELEIGWSFLARRYWGGPWNRDMKRLMIAHALADWPVVVFRIGEHNLRSRLALERLGGRLLERDYEVRFQGQSLRHVLYAIDQPLAP
jgi:RimJ/RimL family protein N-acetyltransferase